MAAGDGALQARVSRSELGAPPEDAGAVGGVLRGGGGGGGGNVVVGDGDGGGGAEGEAGGGGRVARWRGGHMERGGGGGAGRVPGAPHHHGQWLGGEVAIVLSSDCGVVVALLRFLIKRYQYVLYYGGLQCRGLEICCGAVCEEASE